MPAFEARCAGQTFLFVAEDMPAAIKTAKQWFSVLGLYGRGLPASIDLKPVQTEEAGKVET